MRDRPHILLTKFPYSLRIIVALHLAYTNPYTIGNTAVFTTDYIIVLTFVNTNVIAFVNTAVITGVMMCVMAYVLVWEFNGAACFLYNIWIELQA